MACDEILINLTKMRKTIPEKRLMFKFHTEEVQYKHDFSWLELIHVFDEIGDISFLIPSILLAQEPFRSPLIKFWASVPPISWLIIAWTSLLCLVAPYFSQLCTTSRLWLEIIFYKCCQTRSVSSLLNSGFYQRPLRSPCEAVIIEIPEMRVTLYNRRTYH